MVRRLLASIVVSAIAVACLAPATVLAAAGLSLWTQYPAITVNAGDRVNLTLRVSNTVASGRTVDLTVTELPEGWEAALRGGGRVINAVYVEGNESANVELQVQVPSDAPNGEYAIGVRAEGGGGSDSLRIGINVAEGGVGSATLSTQYPVLEGPAGADFDFRLTLTNDGPERQLFAFSADGPEGWQIAFQPAFGDKQVTTVPVDGGAQERVDIKIKVHPRAEAGRYVIPVRATAPGVTAETEVTVAITGTYELRLGTTDQRLSLKATAGRETVLPLVIENAGTAVLEGITLSAVPPTDWTVEFDPESIDRIEPGETVEVTARITPKAKAIAGDYMVAISADSSQTSRRADFRVSVVTPTLWGWLGLFLVAAAVGGTMGVFRVYGRR